MAKWVPRRFLFVPSYGGGGGGNDGRRGRGVKYKRSCFSASWEGGPLHHSYSQMKSENEIEVHRAWSIEVQNKDKEG